MLSLQDQEDKNIHSHHLQKVLASAVWQGGKKKIGNEEITLF